jgi:type IX secretion system PorP/SprF family membrane protein
MPYKAIIITLFTFLTLTGVNGQDIHFSQFRHAPHSINPALTGSFIGDSRIIVNYRSQWYSINDGYKTFGLALERDVLGDRRFFGGFHFFYDRSGDIRYAVSKLFLSGAYRYSLMNHEFKAGVQLGWSFKQFDWNGITTPSQFDPLKGYFNANLPSLEPNAGATTNYPLVNLGTTYRTKLFGNILTEIGLSLFNLNQPTDEFLHEYKVSMSAGGHLIVKIPLSESLNFEPLFMIRNFENANYLLAGSDLKIAAPDNSMGIEQLKTGLMVRSGYSRNIDAVIVHLGVETFNTEYGLSYDINISELQQATNYQGAFEVYFIYKGFNSAVNPSLIPCNRQ